MEKQNKSIFDVIVVGGSYAGLSAALALARSHRKVLIIDTNSPCNKPTLVSHNFLSQDGKSPDVISAVSKSQVLEYKTISYKNALLTNAQKTKQGFEVITDGDEQFESKKIIFATGIKDILPDIPGLAECWGKSVIHCPYCHGCEFQDKKVLVLVTREKILNMIPLINNLSKNLSVVIENKHDIDSELLEKLHKNNIPVIENTVRDIKHSDGQLQFVTLSNGKTVDCDAVYVAAHFKQNSKMPFELGCNITEKGYIDVDLRQKTSVPGVFACGDNATMFRSVATAVYAGHIAGAAANSELSNEEF